MLIGCVWLYNTDYASSSSWFETRDNSIESTRGEDSFELTFLISRVLSQLEVRTVLS